MTYTDPMDALGKCLIDATGYAERHGWHLIRVTGRDYPGREHWAALCPDQEHVRDATMRQFDAAAPAPFTGPLEDWLDTMCELLVDGLDVEVYYDTDVQRDPNERDVWIRDDVEPGPMLRPWETP
jgi:hypothetical protein